MEQRASRSGAGPRRPVRFASALLVGCVVATSMLAQAASPGDEPGVAAEGRVPSAVAGPLADSQAVQPGSAATPEDAGAPLPAGELPDERELDGEVRERLLHLASGPVLRMRSRRVSGAWEVLDDGHWVSLPEGSVLSSRLEHRVLAEYGQRRKALASRAAHPERLAFAGWCFDEGLYTEGLAELDRLLTDDPDHVGALLLLARPALPFALPEWCVSGSDWPAGLVRYGGDAPRALQELVVRELGRSRQDERVPAQLGASLRSPDPGERAFAALAARRLYPEGIAMPELLRRALLDPNGEVRLAAALALRDTGEEGVAVPFVRALESSSSVLRTHAAQGLGVLRFPVVAEPLAARLASLGTSAGGEGRRAPASHIFVGRQIAFVQDFEAEVATSAVIAKPRIGVVQEGATLDVRVQGISGSGGSEVAAGYTQASESRALRHALAQVTGAEVRDSNAAWCAWWEAQGPAWLAAHRPPVEAAEFAPPGS